MDKFETQGLVEDLVEKAGFQFDPRMAKSDADRIIIPAKYKSDRINAVLKIPLSKNPEKQTRMAYDLLKLVADSAHLVPLIGDDPLIFTDGDHQFFGVLMERAENDLECLIQQDPTLKGDEDRIFDIMQQTALGLQQIHWLFFRHRDVKPSNVLLYPGNRWVLADYGTVSDKEATRTAKHLAMYWSPEFRSQTLRGEGEFMYTFDEDIFHLGILLYMCLTGQTERTPFVAYSEANFKGKTGRKISYQNFINEHIEGMECGDKAKHFLRRLLGRRAPKNAKTAERLKKHRYRTVDYLVLDLQGKEYDEGFIETHPHYKKFLRIHKQYVAALRSADQNRDSNIWGLVNDETTDKIMRLHEQFVDYANRDAVKAAPDKDELAGEVTEEQYEAVRAKEREIIVGRVKEFKEKLGRTMSPEDMVRQHYTPLLNAIFLWGPPFTHRARVKPGQKPIYTLEEIKAGNTWYHRDKPWEGAIKQEMLRRRG